MSKKYPKLSETKLDKNTVILRPNLDITVKNGEIVDDSKIRAIIPTLNYLIKANCKTIILSHLGKECMQYKDDISFIPIRFAIGKLVEKPVKFVSINSSQNSIKFMEFGDLLLLENLCFSEEEFTSDKKIQQEFIKKVSSFAEYYIDESFGVDQKLASTTQLPKLLKPLLGLNHESELNVIEKIKKAPKSGFVSLIGGKTKPEKVDMVSRLVKKSEKILLGGQMAQLFLKAKGSSIKENFDKETINKAKEIIKLSKEYNSELIMPSDFIVGDLDGKVENIKTDKLTEKHNVIDIGEATVKTYQDILNDAKFLIVNGTLGINTKEKNGTEEVFSIAALVSPKECYKIVGGEETMAIVSNLKIKNKKFNHTSTSIVELILSI